MWGAPRSLASVFVALALLLGGVGEARGASLAAPSPPLLPEGLEAARQAVAAGQQRAG
jgi:hypothetical protein